MVVERWALKEPLDFGAVVKVDGRRYFGGAELERVRVLEDGEVAVPVSVLKGIEQLATKGAHTWGNDSCATIAAVARSLLPAPPTAEELESALRAVCADDGEDIAQSFARARALLERADAARKGGA